MPMRGVHSRKRGNYQLRPPSSFIVEGTSTERTMVASTKMANARPNPICCVETNWPVAVGLSRREGEEEALDWPAERARLSC